MCNWRYLILLLTVGGSLAIYSSFVTLVTQILCPYGYTPVSPGVSCVVRSRDTVTNTKFTVT